MPRPFLLRFAGAALALACVTTTSSVAAQAPPCDRRDNVLNLLAERYHEAPVAVGVTSRGSLVEVLSATSGDTWTIIVTAPNGVSCLVLSGEGWRPIEQMATDPRT